MNKLEELDADAEALWRAESRHGDEYLRTGKATARPAEEVLREAP